MKTLHWIGSALEDLRAFPASARLEAGTDLGLVQRGVAPRDWKPMPTVGRGVREIRNRTQDGAFRVFYVVEGATDVYVLHAFQKKSQETSILDLEKGRSRYRLIP
jgi:phage-related protein